jgi:hypothetical protein
MSTAWRRPTEGSARHPKALRCGQASAADRLIRRDDVVVLFNTGGALKYLDVRAPGPEEPLTT